MRTEDHELRSGQVAVKVIDKAGAGDRDITPTAKGDEMNHKNLDLVMKKTEERREAAMKFIAITAELPEYERSQVWTQMLHQARAGDWEKIPEPIREWSRQIIKYIDQSGPRPDYWPDQMPW